MKRTLRFQRKYLCIPYVIFLILFIILPILLIVFYAFTDKNGFFSFDAMVDFFSTSTKVSILLNSLFIAVQTTLLCLVIGYPVAYFLANKKYNRNGVLITLFIMPMWINFVLRTGATRDLLTWMGVNGGKAPYFATLVGMVYNYLPFTILPLYTAMLKLDKSQIEAASDLGAKPIQVFTRNILPQSLPGIISAATMVFMPTISSYVISDTMSEGKITLFGSSIYISFSNNQWNTGSFLALIMLIIIFISMAVTHKFSSEPEVRGGTW